MYSIHTGINAPNFWGAWGGFREILRRLCEKVVRGRLQELLSELTKQQQKQQHRPLHILNQDSTSLCIPLLQYAMRQAWTTTCPTNNEENNNNNNEKNNNSCSTLCVKHEPQWVLPMMKKTITITKNKNSCSTLCAKLEPNQTTKSRIILLEKNSWFAAHFDDVLR